MDPGRLSFGLEGYFHTRTSDIHDKVRLLLAIQAIKFSERISFPMLHALMEH